MTALLRSAEVDGHTNWASLIDEALLLAEHEPVLSAYACRIVIDSESLEVALSKLLSERLSTLDVCRQDLFGSFRSTYLDEPSLGIAAWHDLKATKSRDPACFSTLCALLNLKGFQGLQSYRVAHALWLADRKPLAMWISNRVSQEFGIDIHPAARIGQGVMLDHGSGIVIGETAVIERNVSILQNVTLGGTGKNNGDRHPKVKEGVMIGAGAKVIGNIQIGAHSKIAAGSVVLKPVPENSTVAGVPAQVVRTRDAGAAPAETMDQEL